MKRAFKETNSRKATLKIMLDAGASLEYDNKWTSGVAHMVEHMIFQDSNHEGLTRAMAALGAEWSAQTGHDDVAYYINVPEENLKESSELLYHMLFNRTFDKRLFEKEKLVVLEEERGGRDDIDAVINEELDTFLCKGPLSIPVIGTEESIKSISLEEVQSFYDTYYKEERMLAVLTAYKSSRCCFFNNVFGNEFKRSKKYPNIHKKSKRKSIKGKVKQARIFISYNAIPINHKFALPITLLDKFFTNDMDSRLFQSLRQKHGLCYDVGSWLTFYEDIGWYIIETRTNSENINKTIRLIDKEVKNLLSLGITDEELIRAKNKYISDLYSGIETSYGQNDFLANALYNDLHLIEKHMELVENMTVEDIMEACEFLFSKDNRKVFTYLPEK